MSANWGSFGGNWIHYYTSSTSRPIGSKLTLGLEYDGTFERDLVTGVLESQWLRRVSVGYNINASTNVSLGLRGINGLGGFVTEPGNNFAFGFHTRTKNGDIYINYGSPAANVTLNRLIVKYVFRAGPPREPSSSSVRACCTTRAAARRPKRHPSTRARRFDIPECWCTVCRATCR